MRSSVARDQHLFSCPAEEAIEGRQDAEQPAQWEQGLGYVCNICYGENVPEVDSHVRETLAKDQSCGSYVRFVRLIFDVTYGKGASPNNVTTFGPNIVMKNFSQLSVSSFPDDLYAMIQSAFRTAVKIAIDQSVLGELDEEELLFAMEDVLSNWYIGLETSDEWRQSVIKEVPNLFTINCFKSSENRQMMLYKSRILNLKDCDVNVGRLNKEVVKSLWASLSLGTYKQISD